LSPRARRATRFALRVSHAPGCSGGSRIDHPHVPDLSDAAITLWSSAVARRRRAAALTAARSEGQIAIDGAPHAFIVLTGPGERWVAIRRHDDLRVMIAARGLDAASINLEPIADRAARLLGPEPAER